MYENKSVLIHVIYVKKESREVVLTVYYGFIASRLRYTIIFWGNAINVKRVYLAQKIVLE